MENIKNKEKTSAEEELLKALQEGEKSALEHGWINAQDVRKLIEE